MERRAPVSRVWRARLKICGDVEGVGSRAFSRRSCFFAVVRREAIFCGDGGGVDWRWESVVWRSWVDMAEVSGELVEGCGLCC